MGKKYSILLLIWFIGIYQIGATNQIETEQSSYRVYNDSNIIVYNDCKIPLSEFAPKNGKDIYGDVNGGDGGWFAKNLSELNPNCKGIEFEKKEPKESATIVVTYQRLDSITNLKFYYAVYEDSRGWCPDTTNTFTVTIKKHKLEEANGSEQIAVVDSLVVSNGVNESNTSKLISLLPLILILAILVVVIVLYKKNRCNLRRLEDENKKLRNLLNEIKDESKHAVQKPSPIKGNMEERNAMKRDDIIRLIQNEVQKSLSQMTAATKQQSNASIISDQPVKQEKIIQFQETENVVYHSEDNSFTQEPTEIHIFKIYFRGGQYYYTIVNDPTIRKELIGVIQSFEGCIVYQTFGGVASRIEPVTDGMLIKEGNKFYVDANHKLIVRFL